MRVDAAGLLDLVERIHAGEACDAAQAAARIRDDLDG